METSTSSVGGTFSAIPDGRVRVSVRVRPLSSRETEAGCQTCITTHQDTSQITLGSAGKTNSFGNVAANASRIFSYDSIYGPLSEQHEIYNGVAAPLVSSFLTGYNATILAYGQTGSGKTHTMGSCFQQDASEEELGVIPRVARAVFETKDAVLSTSSSSTPSSSETTSSSSSLTLPPPPHRLTASFIEIYNEKTRDLLGPIVIADDADADETGAGGGGGSFSSSSTSSSSSGKDAHPPRTDRFGNVMPDAVTEREVYSLADVCALLAEGAKRRATETTKMNAVSSRSHAILTLKFEVFPPGTDLQAVRRERGDRPSYFLASNNSNTTAASSTIASTASTTTTTASSSTTTTTSGAVTDTEKERERAISLGLNGTGGPGHARLSGPVPARVSLFRLVDLAGSERLAQTGATGARAIEGKNINLSLLTLTKCIKALAQAAEMKQQQQAAAAAAAGGGEVGGAKKPRVATSGGANASLVHIPFRESRLTQLLTNSLGGNSQTVLIACASPADENHDQTRSTLEYAASASKIRGTISLQVDPEAMAAKALRDNLALATAELSRLHSQGVSISPLILEHLRITSATASGSSSSSSINLLTTSASLGKMAISSHAGAGADAAAFHSLTDELMRSQAATQAARASEAKLRADMGRLVESARLLHTQLESQQSILGRLQDDHDVLFTERAIWRAKAEEIHDAVLSKLESTPTTNGGASASQNEEELITIVRGIMGTTAKQQRASGSGGKSGSSASSSDGAGSEVSPSSMTSVVSELSAQVLSLRRQADEASVALAVLEAVNRHSPSSSSSTATTHSKASTIVPAKSGADISPSGAAAKVGDKRIRHRSDPTEVSTELDEEKVEAQKGGEEKEEEEEEAATAADENLEASSSLLGDFELPSEDEILAALEGDVAVRTLQTQANDLQAVLRAEAAREDTILRRYRALIPTPPHVHSSSSSSSVSLSHSPKTVGSSSVLQGKTATSMLLVSDTTTNASATTAATTTTSSSSVSAASATTNSARAILASMEAQHAAALADADAASVRVQELMSDLAARGARIQTLQQELRSVQEEAETAEREHAAEMAELLRAKAALATTTNSNNDGGGGSAAAAVVSDGRVAAAHARVKAARAKQDDTEKVLSTLRADVATLTADKQRLQRVVDEARARAKELDRLKCDLEASNRAKVKLAHQVEDNARRMRAAKEEARAAAVLEQKARAEGGKERAGLRQQVDTLLKLVGRLEAEVAHTKAQAATAASTSSNNSSNSNGNRGMMTSATSVAAAVGAAAKRVAANNNARRQQQQQHPKEAAEMDTIMLSSASGNNTGRMRASSTDSRISLGDEEDTIRLVGVYDEEDESNANISNNYNVPTSVTTINTTKPQQPPSRAAAMQSQRQHHQQQQQGSSSSMRRSHSSLVPGAISAAARKASSVSFFPGGAAAATNNNTTNTNNNTSTSTGRRSVIIPSSSSIAKTATDGGAPVGVHDYSSHYNNNIDIEDEESADAWNYEDDSLEAHQQQSSSSSSSSFAPTRGRGANLAFRRHTSAVVASSALIAEALTTIAAAIINKRDDNNNNGNVETSSSSSTATSTTYNNNINHHQQQSSSTSTMNDGGFASLLGLPGDSLITETEALALDGPNDIPFLRTGGNGVPGTAASSGIAVTSTSSAGARLRADVATARRLAGARRATATIARVVYLNVNRHHIRMLRATAFAERRTATAEANNNTSSSSSGTTTAAEAASRRAAHLSARIATLNSKLSEIEEMTRKEGLDGSRWVTRVLHGHAPMNTGAASHFTHMWAQVDREILGNGGNRTAAVGARSSSSSSSTTPLANMDPYMRSSWITAPRSEALLPWLLGIIVRQTSSMKMLQAALRAVALRESGVSANAIMAATASNSLMQRANTVSSSIHGFGGGGKGVFAVPLNSMPVFKQEEEQQPLSTVTVLPPSTSDDSSFVSNKKRSSSSSLDDLHAYGVKDTEHEENIEDDDDGDDLDNEHENDYQLEDEEEAGDEEDTHMISDFHQHIGGMEAALLLPLLAGGNSNQQQESQASADSTMMMMKMAIGEQSDASVGAGNNTGPITGPRLQAASSFSIIAATEEGDVWGVTGANNVLSSSSSSTTSVTMAGGDDDERHTNVETGVEADSSESMQAVAVSSSAPSANKQVDDDDDDDEFVSAATALGPQSTTITTTTNTSESSSGNNAATDTLSSTASRTSSARGVSAAGLSSSQQQQAATTGGGGGGRQSVIFHSTKTMKAVNPRGRPVGTGGRGGAGGGGADSSTVVPPAVPARSGSNSRRSSKTVAANGTASRDASSSPQSSSSSLSAATSVVASAVVGGGATRKSKRNASDAGVVMGTSASVVVATRSRRPSGGSVVVLETAEVSSSNNVLGSSTALNKAIEMGGGGGGKRLASSTSSNNRSSSNGRGGSTSSGATVTM